MKSIKINISSGEDILIVDDTPANLNLLEEILTGAGYQVRSADDGELALRSVQTKLPALILLDIKMPGMDGFEVCRRLKENKITGSVPIIFISILEDERDKVKGFQAGGVDYINKPFHAEEVLARVNTHLTLHRVQMNLEERVRERSIELEEVNLKLRQQIQEHLLTLEALRESEQKYRQIVDTSNEGIWMLDKNSLTTLVNTQMTQMLGYEREEMIGQRVDVFMFDEDVPDQHSRMETRRKGISEHYERRFRRKDGQTVWTLASAAPVFDGQHLFNGSFAMFTDITERKQAEEERGNLQCQLFHAQKMESIGRLAGGVAHDFNNMLGVIIGYTQIAMMEVNHSDTLYCQLQEILQAAQRSAVLTRQLLTFARRQTARPMVMDLNETVSGMVKMLRCLIGEDIELIWAPGNNLCKVRMDPSQIDQILANLVVNSRDAIRGHGIITLKTGNKIFDDTYCTVHVGHLPGNYVLLEVNDTGAGMSKETMEHIFEPFFTTKEMGKGTGLGLATVYGIVRQNNGFINVHSEPGKGTSFKIYLPSCETEIFRPMTEMASNKLPGGIETVLVTEDEETNLNICRTILEKVGYTVLAARTPEEAIHLAENHNGNIHLLITDVVMPGMNGIELWKRLYNIRPGLKCLYISGYTANVISHNGLLDKDINFIQKPFLVNILAEKVRDILDAKENRKD